MPATLKRNSKKILVNAPDDQCFWVTNGPVLKNLEELRSALESGSITDEQFHYHVSRGKNDFSAWISGVLSDEPAAKALSRVKTRKTATRVLSERLKNLR